MVQENVIAKKTLSETNVPNVLLSILDFQIVRHACAMPTDPLTILVTTMENVLAMPMLKERNVTNVLWDMLNFQPVINVMQIIMVSLNAKVCQYCIEKDFEIIPDSFLACDCNVEGSESTQCDDDGKCTCKANIVGDKCDQSEPGYFGFPEPTECNCNAEGSFDQNCENASGKCTCKEHVVGDKCDQCALGFFGFPQCKGNFYT